MAMQVVARVREHLGVELGLREVFEQARLGDLARVVERSLRGSALPELRPLPAGAVPVLSFAQQRLWFLSRLGEAAGAAYTISAAVELRGALDEAALRRALVLLTERQQSLRMNVATVAGDPVLRLREPYDPLRVAEGEPSPAAVAAALGAPFDLEHDALLRLVLWRLAPDGAVLGLRSTTSSLTAGRWTCWWASLVRCMRPSAPGRGRLAALAVQYVDYAAWQRGWLTGRCWSGSWRIGARRLRGRRRLWNCRATSRGRR